MTKLLQVRADMYSIHIFRETESTFSYEVTNDEGLAVYICPWGFATTQRAEAHAKDYCKRHHMKLAE